MFAQISLDRHSSNRVENFIQAVMDAPEIVACYAVTGDADFLLKIVVPDPEQYDRFLHRFFFNLPAVRQTRTIVVLRVIKIHPQLPLMWKPNATDQTSYPLKRQHTKIAERKCLANVPRETNHKK